MLNNKKLHTFYFVSISNSDLRGGQVGVVGEDE